MEQTICLLREKYGGDTLTSAHPNICTYPMIADLKDRKSNATTPFVIANFSHHKHLHLLKDHVVAFTEKDCNEGEVLEICTMEQLEKDIPRNWIPERKRQEKLSEFFENPFMKKDDDFLKSPAEAPGHRKVLLEDKNISSKTQEAVSNRISKTKIGIRFIILRQVSIQQSFIRTHTSTSIFPEAD